MGKPCVHIPPTEDYITTTLLESTHMHTHWKETCPLKKILVGRRQGEPLVAINEGITPVNDLINVWLVLFHPYTSFLVKELMRQGIEQIWMKLKLPWLLRSAAVTHPFAQMSNMTLLSLSKLANSGFRFVLSGSRSCSDASKVLHEPFLPRKFATNNGDRTRKSENVLPHLVCPIARFNGRYYQALMWCWGVFWRKCSWWEPDSSPLWERPHTCRRYCVCSYCWSVFGPRCGCWWAVI